MMVVDDRFHGKRIGFLSITLIWFLVRMLLALVGDRGKESQTSFFGSEFSLISIGRITGN